MAARADESHESQEGDRSQQPQPAKGTYHAATVPATGGEWPFPKVPPVAAEVPIRARDGPASRPAERGPCHPESVAALAVDGSATFG